MSGDRTRVRAARAAALAAILLLGVVLRLVPRGGLAAGPVDRRGLFPARGPDRRRRAHSPLFSTTPMRPREFAFVNDFRYYPTNLVLYGVAGRRPPRRRRHARPARLVSSFLSLLVLLASIALAREATRERPFGLPASRRSSSRRRSGS